LRISGFPPAVAPLPSLMPVDRATFPVTVAGAAAVKGLPPFAFPLRLS
jgi:hypothetical protein